VKGRPGRYRSPFWRVDPAGQLDRWMAIFAANRNFTMWGMDAKANDSMKKSQIFRLGDTVQIVSGPFAAFTGKVEGINQAKGLVKVRVTIFGRPAPVKLLFSQIKNVSSR